MTKMWNRLCHEQCHCSKILRKWRCTRLQRYAQNYSCLLAADGGLIEPHNCNHRSATLLNLIVSALLILALLRWYCCPTGMLSLVPWVPSSLWNIKIAWHDVFHRQCTSWSMAWGEALTRSRLYKRYPQRRSIWIHNGPELYRHHVTGVAGQFFKVVIFEIETSRRNVSSIINWHCSRQSLSDRIFRDRIVSWWPWLKPENIEK